MGSLTNLGEKSILLLSQVLSTNLHANFVLFLNTFLVLNAKNVTGPIFSEIGLLKELSTYFMIIWFALLLPSSYEESIEL
jgi:hypothetical protein